MFKEVKYFNINGYSCGFRGEKSVAKSYAIQEERNAIQKVTQHNENFGKANRSHR